MDVLSLIILITLIPLLILSLGAWALSVYATYHSIFYPEPGSSRSSRLASILGLVAADLAFPVVIAKGVVLILEIIGALSGVSEQDVEIRVAPFYGIVLLPALIACLIAIFILARTAFMSARRKATETGEGLWISRHSDG
jgi:hypothetical protein